MSGDTDVLRVLAAGDLFVRPGLLADAVRAEVPDADVREITLPWPDVPFGPVGGVEEASGTEDQMIEALDGVVACVTQMAPLTARVLDACPDLRLFCVGRGGPVNADLAAAAEAGVTVTFAPGRNAVATAEHTIALLLAAARRVPAVHAELRGGTWRGDYYRYDAVGPEVAGATAGIVGYGAIGALVAQRLQGLGAEVVVFDPYADADALAEAGVEAVEDLDELMRRSSFVTVHARATPETAGLVSAERVALLPEGAVLVNCARGSLVDYDAVCDALDAGRLFGAAFDVFPTEPVPDGSRLLTTEGVVMTPHLAGASRETAHNAAALCAAEVGRFARGEPLVNIARA
ncbi:2-hydroxyacid dehydrogenase [Nocardioides marinquilinus]|uniref:2-hydroxyacid dehydrogenase n=1 Tax=Nocardioides marinquilinus TaxID=1210400 RepID=A0ABP9Q483_9ACTN